MRVRFALVTAALGSTLLFPGCEPLPARTASTQAPGIELPWPVPSPSTSMEIPPELRPPAEPGARLPLASEWLEKALTEAGYRDLAWYDVPGGFAVRTHVELIDDQGLGLTPPDPALRFSTQLPQRRFFTTTFWSELLASKVGRFRCFVFLVVDKPLTYSTDVTDGHLAWRPPSHELPLSRVDHPYDAHDKWYALVYEFEHPRDQPSAKLAGEPADPAVHLEKSGVLPALRKLARPG